MPEIPRVTRVLKDPYRSFQDRARQRVASGSGPARTDERWRFSDLKRADLSGFGHRAEVKTEWSGSADAIEKLSLAEALRTFGGRIEPLLSEKLGVLGTDFLLARALGSDWLGGQCLIIPESLCADQPLILTHHISGPESAAFPLTIILAEKGARLTVMEKFQSGQDAVLTVGGALLLADEGADLTHIVLQELNPASKFVHASHLIPCEAATARSFNCNMGASWVRQETGLSIHSPEASGHLYGLNLAGDGQEIDQRTRQHHAAGGCRSDLLFKNALFGRSKTIFSGIIQVDEGAHFTDAYQTCRNLLLSDQAEANALPGLEINADQVRCSHGATSARIDPEELFYLRSRGIPEDAAQHLITLGFAGEVIGKIGDETIQQEMSARFEARLREYRRS